MTDFIIETHQLTKSFKGQPALRGLDLRVPPGNIFGFLGRNGAGKTTTIKYVVRTREYQRTRNVPVLGRPDDHAARS